MPTGVRSEKTNRKNSQRARREWERWEREQYTIYNQEGDEAFVPANDEIFVSLFHYKEDKNLKKYPNAVPVKGKIDPRYKVSNKGNVISFTFYDIDRPYLMSQSEKLNNRNEPYMVVGSGWSVHSLVWFSFAADAIKNGYEFPKSYGIPVHEIKTLTKLAKLTGVEIHHKDLNTRNNSLDNLECDAHKFHVLLHDLGEKDEDTRMETIIDKHPFTTPTMVELDGTLSISEIDADQFIQKAYGDKKELQWAVISQLVLSEVLQEVGTDFFKRDWYMGIRVNDTVAFFTVTKQETGMSVKWLTQENHYQLANKELDIYCDNGRIYLMNYTNADD